jgi:hypothetical protein
MKESKQLDVLKEYNKDVFMFLWINFLSIVSSIFFFLIIKNNSFNMSFIILLVCSIVYFLFFMEVFRMSMNFMMNRNKLLGLALMFVVVYSITLDEGIFSLIWVCMLFSALYEILVRYYYGAEVRFRLVKLKWCVENKR